MFEGVPYSLDVGLGEIIGMDCINLISRWVIWQSISSIKYCGCVLDNFLISFIFSAKMGAKLSKRYPSFSDCSCRYFRNSGSFDFGVMFS